MKLYIEIDKTEPFHRKWLRLNVSEHDTFGPIVTFCETNRVIDQIVCLLVTSLKQSKFLNEHNLTSNTHKLLRTNTTLP